MASYPGRQVMSLLVMSTLANRKDFSLPRQSVPASLMELWIPLLVVILWTATSQNVIDLSTIHLLLAFRRL
jgi:hypothetical protein